MTAEMPGLLGLKRVKWNFEKFLIGPDGKVRQRWASTTKPETLKAPIEAELKKSGAEPVAAADAGGASAATGAAAGP